jgi:type IV secretory pathway VirD2 relaxase
MSDADDLLDLPTFRPRIGRRNKQDRDAKLYVAVMRRLARVASPWRSGGGHSRPGRQARHDTGSLPDFARRCVVKAHYVPVRGAGTGASHLGYIERDGVEQDGSKGRLFSEGGDIDRKTFSADIPGEKRQFRFIVSPEDGDHLDLRDFTQRLMQRMESDFGRKLRWGAVCHYNTDNSHVHVVVRGIDRHGDDLIIDRAYISAGLRHRGQDLATIDLGPRSELDLNRQLSREIAQERLTSIDRRLARIVSAEETIEMKTLVTARGLSRPHALARLQTLEEMGLVERTSPTSWRFADGWQEELERLGQRGDIIKRIHRELPDRSLAYRVFEPSAGAVVEGEIKRKGLHDELTGMQFAILQTRRKEAVYVRLDEATASTLMEGVSVRLTSQPQPWVKATDHVIEREAATNRGIYDPTAHLRKLGTNLVQVGGRRVQPKDVIDVNRRRLARLERFKLATPLPDGTWRIAPNLVETLRAREQTHPKFAIRVGPLDRGLDLRALGQSVAGQLRMSYVSEPIGFRGRLTECVVAPSGREYAQVVDDRSGQFTLIPKPPEWDRLSGRTVELSRDHAQKLVIRPDLGLSR